MERSTQLLRGVLDMCLLAVLADQECYGYEIARRLQERGLQPVAEGSIYPALSRLTSSGQVESRWETSSRGPRRKYYRLGPEGQDQLRVWRAEWHQFRDAVDQVVGKGAPIQPDDREQAGRGVLARGKGGR